MPDTIGLTPSLKEMQSSLTRWLFDKALPIWWNTGADREKGGFYEKLNLDGTPYDIDRRTRVAARQVFSYALAESMGYKGETDPAIRQGLAWLSGPAKNPDTGFLYATLSPTGQVVRGEFDFYDHAFAMLAYASAYRVRPDKALEEAAVFIRDGIVKNYSHPVRGFEESNPRPLPLKANPHMHMFEACLAWIDAGGDATWEKIAAEIAALCVDKFLHPQTGALREFFDGDWNPMPGDAGRIVEPGHQFEWAWLLHWYGALSGTDQAALTDRLWHTACNHGLDRSGLCFDEIDIHLAPRKRSHRLWPHTEALKAAVIRHEAGDAQAGGVAATMADALTSRFLSRPFPAGWVDRIDPEGRPLVDFVPASSLYHLYFAFSELERSGTASASSAR